MVFPAGTDGRVRAGKVKPDGTADGAAVVVAEVTGWSVKDLASPSNQSGVLASTPTAHFRRTNADSTSVSTLGVTRRERPQLPAAASIRKPSSRMFMAAFMSRSRTEPHSHIHDRSERVKLSLTALQR